MKAQLIEYLTHELIATLQPVVRSEKPSPALLPRGNSPRRGYLRTFLHVRMICVLLNALLGRSSYFIHARTAAEGAAPFACGSR